MVVEHAVDDGFGLGGGLPRGAGEHIEGHIPGPHDLQGVLIGDVDLVVRAPCGHFGCSVQPVQHSDDRVGGTVDGQGLPQGLGIAPEGLLGQIGPDDAHVLPPGHVQIGEEPPLSQLLTPVHGGLGVAVEHDLADSVELGLVKFLVPVAQSGLEGDIGGHAGEHVRVGLHQVVHVRGVQIHGGTVSPAPHVGLHHIDAQLIHLFVDHPLDPVAQSQDDDDRGHADDDAQHGEQGAHLAGGQGLDGQTEGLSCVHAPTSCSSSSSPASPGCTTARGSWASPS